MNPQKPPTPQSQPPQNNQFVLKLLNSIQNPSHPHTSTPPVASQPAPISLEQTINMLRQQQPPAPMPQPNFDSRLLAMIAGQQQPQPPQPQPQPQPQAQQGGIPANLAAIISQFTNQNQQNQQPAQPEVTQTHTTGHYEDPERKRMRESGGYDGEDRWKRNRMGGAPNKKHVRTFLLEVDCKCTDSWAAESWIGAMSLLARREMPQRGQLHVPPRPVLKSTSTHLDTFLDTRTFLSSSMCLYTASIFHSTYTLHPSQTSEIWYYHRPIITPHLPCYLFISFSSRNQTFSPSSSFLSALVSAYSTILALSFISVELGIYFGGKKALFTKSVHLQRRNLVHPGYSIFVSSIRVRPYS
jgi:hypothetical protein